MVYPPASQGTDDLQTHLRDETDIITISDSDASLTDTGVHWDFGTSSSCSSHPVHESF